MVREMKDTYEDHRGLLFSIAYRMLGSVTEAEDVVQEAFLRFHRATTEGEVIDSPKAYLSTVATRLAIDQLRSARMNREQYVGTWLPEPLLTEEVEDAARHTETADSLSMAFLLILETLSPVERAVFLLREVFGYEYAEIAEIVGKTEDNARQLAARARKRLEVKRPRFEASKRKREELARSFLAAVVDGDMDALVGILAADAMVQGDGGGKAAAVPRSIVGREQAARFLLGLGRFGRRTELRVVPREVNGQPGFVAVEPDGRVASVMTVEIADGFVQAVRAVVNPDKLRHIAPPA